MNRVRRNQGQESGADFDVKKLFGSFTMDVIARYDFAVENVSDDNDPFFVNANKFFFSIFFLENLCCLIDSQIDYEETWRVIHGSHGH